jgi:hypothetical protein
MLRYLTHLCSGGKDQGKDVKRKLQSRNILVSEKRISPWKSANWLLLLQAMFEETVWTEKQQFEGMRVRRMLWAMQLAIQLVDIRCRFNVWKHMPGIWRKTRF